MGYLLSSVISKNYAQNCSSTARLTSKDNEVKTKLKTLLDSKTDFEGQ